MSGVIGMFDPGGADAWAMQNELAQGATVGAPPDLFNQQGQDWGENDFHARAGGFGRALQPAGLG